MLCRDKYASCNHKGALREHLHNKMINLMNIMIFKIIDQIFFIFCSHFLMSLWEGDLTEFLTWLKTFTSVEKVTSQNRKINFSN